MSSLPVLNVPRHGNKYGRPVLCIRRPRCGRPDCSGKASTCRHCHAAKMRAWRPKHSELSDEARRRLNCRAYTNVYQRRGLLPRGPCEVCAAAGVASRTPVENHHPDYNDPRTFRRLCREHHRKLHREGDSHAASR